MSIPAKFVVVVLCAVICAMGFLPRSEKRQRGSTPGSVTPAQLRDKPKANWLLV
ncbi:MAG: hypothetical protein ACJ8IQ_05015 [Chthoniobacterales bacterium]